MSFNHLLYNIYCSGGLPETTPLNSLCRFLCSLRLFKLALQFLSLSINTLLRLFETFVKGRFLSAGCQQEEPWGNNAAHQ